MKHQQSEQENIIMKTRVQSERRRTLRTNVRAGAEVYRCVMTYNDDGKLVYSECVKAT